MGRLSVGHTFKPNANAVGGSCLCLRGIGLSRSVVVVEVTLGVRIPVPGGTIFAVVRAQVVAIWAMIGNRPKLLLDCSLIGYREVSSLKW